MHLGVRARPAAGDGLLRQIGRKVGPVGRHRLDVGEQRLVGMRDVTLHLVQRVLVVEAVALVDRSGALVPQVVDLRQADGRVEAVVGHEVAQHRIEHDIAIAAARQRLGHRIVNFSRHQELHERAHPAEWVCGDAGQQREFREPGSPAIGFHPELVQSSVVRFEEAVEASVILELREIAGRHDGFLVDQHDVRRLDRGVAAGGHPERRTRRLQRSLQKLAAPQRFQRLRP